MRTRSAAANSPLQELRPQRKPRRPNASKQVPATREASTQTSAVAIRQSSYVDASTQTYRDESDLTCDHSVQTTMVVQPVQEPQPGQASTRMNPVQEPRSVQTIVRLKSPPEPQSEPDYLGYKTYNELLYARKGYRTMFPTPSDWRASFDKLTPDSNHNDNEDYSPEIIQSQWIRDARRRKQHKRNEAQYFAGTSKPFQRRKTSLTSSEQGPNEVQHSSATPELVELQQTLPSSDTSEQTEPPNASQQASATASDLQTSDGIMRPRSRLFGGVGSAFSRLSTSVGRLFGSPLPSDLPVSAPAPVPTPTQPLSADGSRSLQVTEEGSPLPSDFSLSSPVPTHTRAVSADVSRNHQDNMINVTKRGRESLEENEGAGTNGPSASKRQKLTTVTSPQPDQVTEDDMINVTKRRHEFLEESEEAGTNTPSPSKRRKMTTVASPRSVLKKRSKYDSENSKPTPKSTFRARFHNNCVSELKYYDILTPPDQDPASGADHNDTPTKVVPRATDPYTGVQFADGPNHFQEESSLGSDILSPITLANTQANGVSAFVRTPGPVVEQPVPAPAPTSTRRPGTFCLDYDTYDDTDDLEDIGDPMEGLTWVGTKVVSIDFLKEECSIPVYNPTSPTPVPASIDQTAPATTASPSALDASMEQTTSAAAAQASAEQPALAPTSPASPLEGTGAIELKPGFIVHTPLSLPKPGDPLVPMMFEWNCWQPYHAMRKSGAGPHLEWGPVLPVGMGAPAGRPAPVTLVPHVSHLNLQSLSIEQREEMKEKIYLELDKYLDWADEEWLLKFGRYTEEKWKGVIQSDHLMEMAALCYMPEDRVKEVYECPYSRIPVHGDTDWVNAWSNSSEEDLYVLALNSTEQEIQEEKDNRMEANAERLMRAWCLERGLEPLTADGEPFSV